MDDPEVVPAGDGPSGDDGLRRGHRREIAVLCCDLRGVVSFSEVAEPEEVMDVLRQVRRIIGVLTNDLGATVGPLAADGIMVFFEDPVHCPEPADRALRMAVALRARMASMARDWRRRGLELGFGMGISLGYATLGEIESEAGADYAVVGRVVDMAARLGHQARHGQLLVGKQAHNAVEELADSEEIGPLSLTGVHGPVAAFNVVGLKAQAASVS